MTHNHLLSIVWRGSACRYDCTVSPVPGSGELIGVHADDSVVEPLQVQGEVRVSRQPSVLGHDPPRHVHQRNSTSGLQWPRGPCSLAALQLFLGGIPLPVCRNPEIGTDSGCRVHIAAVPGGILLPVCNDSGSCSRSSSVPRGRRGGGRGPRRATATQLSDDVITGSDDVIALGGDRLRTPIEFNDDVIFCK